MDTLGDRHRSKTFIIQKMVQAISYGAKGNIIWQYRPEIFGQESPNFGLVFEDGTYTERAKAISRLAKNLKNIVISLITLGLISQI